jgi:aminopeptidase N
MMKSGFLTICVLLLGLASCKYGPWLKYLYPHRPGHFPKFSRHEKFVGGANHFRTCYDVTFYNIDVGPDWNKRYLKGRVDIHFTTLHSFDTLLLDLHPCFKVTSINTQNSAARIKRKKDALFVIFKEKQLQGTKNVISINYEGYPVQAKVLSQIQSIHFNSDSSGKPYINTSSQGIGSHRLWPCKYLLYDKPDSSAMRITLPKGMVAVSNGKLRKFEEGKVLDSYSWFNSYPINIYNICFEAGDFVKLDIPYANGSAYVFRYNEEKAKRHFKQVPEIIIYLESVFGEYPWKNDGYKLIETPVIDGMEHQTAISCSFNFRNNGAGYDDLIVHETAHEWMGNSITAFDYSDVWIHESFANYAEYLYYEHMWGSKKYWDAMAYILSHEDEIKRRMVNKSAVVKPSGVRYCSWASNRDQDIYGKGALMLHTFRYMLQDDSLFFKIIRTFYTEHERSIVNTKTWTDHVNKISGKNYDWFFKQYLYNYKLPEFNYSLVTEKKTGITSLEFQWKNTFAGFTMPVWIIDGKDTMKLSPVTEKQKIRISDAEKFRVIKGTGLFNVVRK